MNQSYGSKYCIIGAGPSGLAAAKNLKQCHIPFDCFERDVDLGGVWNYGQASSSAYQSLHLITSAATTEFADFPFPGDFPTFPSHRQVLAYLRSYAEHFDLYPDITFGTAVRRVEPVDGGWKVHVDGDGAARQYAGVIIANGHHWDPRVPELPGEFNGITMHSRQYKTPDVLRGRRVLVVGAGNSGCDIAVEAAQHADAVFLSMRRGYYFLPKLLFGRPTDLVGETMLRLRVPLWLRQLSTRLLLEVVVGTPEQYGVPKPDHRIFESHPTANSLLLYYVRHGEIQVKPDLEELCGDRVRFTDGSVEPVDVIVYATGYNLRFPFIDESYLLDEVGQPRLFLNAFHPELDNLFVVGLLQPDSGAWPLADRQARLIACFLEALKDEPPAASWFQRVKADTRVSLSGGIKFVKSPRHVLEVEHFTYRRRLQRLIARFERSRKRLNERSEARV
jgi:cation diffusion facilitator CzcD-associated flavoprotein CzcO